MKRRLFQGADLIITPTPLEQELPGKVIVVTEHAEAISDVIFSLQQEYADRINYYNKYAFYPALGKAALDYLKEHNDLEGLTQAVRNAARNFRF